MKQKLEQVTSLLSDKLNQLIDFTEDPHDYPSLLDCILYYELAQELEILLEMSTDPNTFEQQFRKRCLIRENDKENCISFHLMPKTMTNQLYLEIALLLQPANMKAILEILLPSSKLLLEARVVYKPNPALLKNQITRRSYLPEIELDFAENLDCLENIVPSMETFCQFVFVKDKLINLNEISKFPLKLHSMLQTQLINMDCDDLIKQLYSHNESLERLSQDILLLNNKGLSPGKALEQLVARMKVSGETMTGSEELASESSIEDIRRFFEYFNALSEDLKTQLRALKNEEGVSLGQIIDKQIMRVKCIETACNDLSSLLRINANNPLLTNPPDMSQEALVNLCSKYGPEKELKIEKEVNLLPTFPLNLSKSVIENISPQTDEDLLNLIMFFPPTIYNLLWENLTLDKPKRAYKRLVWLVQENYFNPEQKNALAIAMANNFARFNIETPVLFLALAPGDHQFFQAFFSAYPKDQRLSAVIETYEDEEDEIEYTFLHMAIKDAKILETMLSLIPEDLREVAVNMKNGEEKSTLHSVSKNPELLDIVLSSLPKDHKLNAVNSRNSKGKTVLHKAASHPACLRMILTHLPEDQRLGALLQTDQFDNDVLSFIEYEDECIEITLSLLTGDYRLEAMCHDGIWDEIEDDEDDNENVDFIKNILPDFQKESLKFYSILLHKAANKPQIFKTIL